MKISRIALSALTCAGTCLAAGLLTPAVHADVPAPAGRTLPAYDKVVLV